VATAFIAIFTRFNSKFPFEQEQDYQLSLTDEKLKAGIITPTITATLYVVFFILDIFSLPSLLNIAVLVRGTFVFLSILVFYLILKKENIFIQYYQSIISGYFLVAGLGLVLLLAMAKQYGIASEYYFSGIMLVMFTTHGSTYLQANNALAVSVILTVITVFILFMTRSNDQMNAFQQIFINSLMLISSIIAGVLSVDIRNRSSRNNFVLQANTERHYSEKSHFFAAASHDIRQPLQAINFLASALRTKNTQPNDDALFERLENSVESMSDLLNSLLDVSKLDAQVIIPKPKHLSLTPLFERLQGELDPFTNAKGIKLIFEHTNDIVLADTILLEQVLNNLLSNAIRYTNTGNITVLAQSESEYINIKVKDTGLGIALDDQEAIFNEFHQVHNPERDQSKGLGLGLSIIKRLCLLQDWPLSLESELGVGSCFSFKVPKGNSELIQVVNKVNMSNSLGAIDAIVIDDNESIRFSLSTILSNWGCTIRTFDSADEACEAIDQLPSWKPNLLICDYRLRNNVTGLEAIDDVKKSLNYSIETIIITGDTAPSEIMKIQKSGFIVLHKPIKPAKLRFIISKKMKSIIE
jgi:signal transduction histidine kinase/CheY-like chemotaxis protein